MQGISIEKPDIEKLLPHAGDMCLLDLVKSWDQQSLTAHSSSHLLSNNPLRSNNQLNSVMAIEYAAQAAALHRALNCSEETQQVMQGYLAALNQVDFILADLSTIEKKVIIKVDLVVAESNKVVYQFNVKSNKINICRGQMIIAENI